MESQTDMTENEKPLDQAAEDELKGVPEHLREGGDEVSGGGLGFGRGAHVGRVTCYRPWRGRRRR